ncbi:hypothetical protein [Pleionea sediminis]|uniref:hypothetical protein n=1 Tax=Pleionea sediminis TaxID=2569479 RepID=UPI00118606E9|nr:hypothetical protein [Pleionea sediminis]
MKKYVIAIVVSLIIGVIVYALIPGDTENRFNRLGVSYFDGDYVITYYGMSGMNIWLVKDGKVTSEPAKGYYHTRVLTGNKSSYLQLPITNTVIEEFKSIEKLAPDQQQLLKSKYSATILAKF